MLLAEDTVDFVCACTNIRLLPAAVKQLECRVEGGAVSILSVGFALDFHAIVSPTSTFNVKGNVALGSLALHTGTFFLKADNTLEIESPLLKLVQLNGSLGSDNRPWNPGCTT